jgi:glutamate racemase
VKRVIDRDLPIGVFDTGIGGMTVLNVLSSRLPLENMVYLADSKRAPYGDLSSETIVQYVLDAVLFLQTLPVKMVVLACHTASASCLYGPFASLFLSQIEVPVLGMVESSVQMVRKFPHFKKIAILGTSRTIDSGVYQTLLRSHHSDLELFPIPCPRLAPLIEDRDACSIDRVLCDYLAPLKGEKIDAVLLSCTHYPLILEKIRQVLGQEVMILDPSEQTSLAVERFLLEKGQNKLDGKGLYTSYTTGEPSLFLNNSCVADLKQSLPCHLPCFSLQ